MGTSVPLWAAILSSVLTSLTGGALAAALTTRESRRAGVRADERAARRDEVEDREWLVEHWQNRAEKAEARSDDLEAELRAEREYSAQLRDHIYRRADPPPPPRPTA